MSGETQFLSIAPAIVLAVTLVISSITDVLFHRIPNVLLACALAVAITTSLSTNGLHGLFDCVAGLGIGLLILMPFYVMGGMGAADVKLLGVAGSFLGGTGVLVAGLATLVIGAVYGIAWAGWRLIRPTGNQGGVNLWFPRLAAVLPSLAIWLGNFSSTPQTTGAVAGRAENGKKMTFAYAPAIATGSAFAMWQQGWITTLYMSF